MTSSQHTFHPMQDVFQDVTARKLCNSSWRVFNRIRKLQGYRAALRVFPVIWLIVNTVRGFAEFHKLEYERMLVARANGLEPEEVMLDAAEQDKYQSLGAWLCRRLTELGPTFIKIGQTLSTRADLMPIEAMLELAKLQEQVTPFPNQVAFALIESELGGRVKNLYGSFDEEPIAAASLSQAYRATTKEGREVVVKVQRPDLAKSIAADVQILAAVADEVMLYPNLCRHTDWPGVVQEFSRTIFEEIDYIREGRNADYFRRAYRDFELVYIPRIFWRLTGRRVLTLEYVDGAKVTDTEALASKAISREEITRVGANFYLKQLLEDGFFHADPHPGNLRIMADGRVGIFDFGMVGHISPALKESLVSAFLHTIERDYRALVDDFVAMGFVDAKVDREMLTGDLSPILEKRFAAGMSRIKFRQVLFDFSDVVWRYPFRLPTEFTFIMRALLTLEGVALTINPKFNFVDATMPFAQRVLLKNGSTMGKALLKEVFTDGRFDRRAAMRLFRAAARLPDLA